MRTLEQILKEGIKDTDWTYCKAEYAPHDGCKIGMPTEYTPDGTTKFRREDLLYRYGKVSEWRDNDTHRFHVS